MELKDFPVVAINQEGLFIYLNKPFQLEYGWSEEDLLGKPVMEIMPSHMRSAHMVGFSRYLATEKSELLGKTLPLKVLYKNGKEAISDHYILGREVEGRWEFAAIIDYPKSNE